MLCNYSIDWGSVPDWLAGIGTVGTLAFFGIQLRNEKRRHRAEEQRRVDEARDREASQARLVAARAAWDYGPSSGHAARITVRNDSPSPITDVQVQLMSRRDQPPSADLWETAEGLPQPVIDAGGSTEFRLVPPHQPPAPRDGMDTAAYDAPRKLFVPCVVFTDAAGLRWARTESEQPRRLVAD
ncbi:hypothetical protein Van01_05000 [Micromonospora andamanensis]|uniref:Uncharacterized protein n=1 Tax=Micromonospora andamanensis TaxID=1287068 RepID=A0ABQ4HNR8_9ACTN|nr:hypothetical protein Van01_05000 [Micromonospora andamanensis]